jgi:cell division protein ZapA
VVDKPNLVHVEIFGQSYAVKAGSESGYVEELAAYVDEQMREVARQPGAVDSLRIAVLAALNVANELFELRARSETGPAELESRAARLARDLSAVVDE